MGGMGGMVSWGMDEWDGGLMGQGGVGGGGRWAQARRCPPKQRSVVGLECFLPTSDSHARDRIRILPISDIRFPSTDFRSAKLCPSPPDPYEAVPGPGVLPFFGFSSPLNRTACRISLPGRARQRAATSNSFVDFPPLRTGTAPGKSLPAVGTGSGTAAECSRLSHAAGSSGIPVGRSSIITGSHQITRTASPRRFPSVWAALVSGCPAIRHSRLWFLSIVGKGPAAGRRPRAAGSKTAARRRNTPGGFQRKSLSSHEQSENRYRQETHESSHSYLLLLSYPLLNIRILGAEEIIAFRRKQKNTQN